LIFDLLQEKREKVFKREGGIVDGGRGRSSKQVLAKPAQPSADSLDHNRPGMNGKEILDLGSREEVIDLGNLAEDRLRKGGRHFTSPLQNEKCKVQNEK
jgi:hypothetical protein